MKLANLGDLLAPCTWEAEEVNKGSVSTHACYVRLSAGY